MVIAATCKPLTLIESLLYHSARQSVAKYCAHSCLRRILLLSTADNFFSTLWSLTYSNHEHFEQDSSGIFWDNDSLAALLALELKADLLILLSDVDGLYNGPPSDPQSKLIHTYVKERHQGQITFGDKSRLGRGGMTAKVKAAVYAAYAGVPVIIARYAFMHLV